MTNFKAISSWIFVIYKSICFFFFRKDGYTYYVFSSQQQIRDLHIAKRVEDIGFYAGFVGKNSPNNLNFFSSFHP